MNRDQLVGLGHRALGSENEAESMESGERWGAERYLGTEDIDMVIGRHRHIAFGEGFGNGERAGRAAGVTWATTRFMEAGNTMGCALAVEIQGLVEYLEELLPGPRGEDRRSRLNMNEQLQERLDDVRKLTPLLADIGVLIAQASGGQS